MHVGEEVREGLIADMDPDELIAAAETLDIDDLADLVEDLPDTVIDEVLKSMDRENRERLEQVLSYPEDSAGRLLNPDVITVRADVTVDVVLRYLRLRGEMPEHTDHLFVVSRRHQYLGRIPLIALLTNEPATPINELIDDEQPAIAVAESESEVARQFSDHDWLSAPVVDNNNILLGRITIDDVVDIIREKAEHQAMGAAGLDEEVDLFAPIARTTRSRAIWLGINLLTAFLASWVIGNFQPVMQKYVATAVLMTIVASMGGIAGTQTLTIMVRRAGAGSGEHVQPDAAAGQGNLGRAAQRPAVGLRCRHHLVRRLPRRDAVDRIRRSDGDRFARRGPRRRVHSADPEAHGHRPCTGRRHDPDDGHRLLRLRKLSRAGDVDDVAVKRPSEGPANTCALGCPASSLQCDPTGVRPCR